MAVPMTTQRIEVITGREVRRQYAEDEKLRLVEAAFGPGVKTAEFARRAGVDQSLLYRWRRQFFGSQPRVPAFMAVTMLPETAPACDAVAQPGPPLVEVAGAVPAGLVEIEFPGGVRLRVTGVADVAVVTAAISALKGRPS